MSWNTNCLMGFSGTLPTGGLSLRRSGKSLLIVSVDCWNCWGRMVRLAHPRAYMLCDHSFQVRLQLFKRSVRAQPVTNAQLLGLAMLDELVWPADADNGHFQVHVVQRFHY